MPYDTSAFRQSNSQLVPGYAGNTLKEYSELLADKQQKYETGMALYDELGNALHGVVGTEKDNPQLQALYGKYSKQLADYASKGNFEDLVPTITRTARQFANDYQPFAAAYQQRSAYMADLKKRLDEGKISEEQFGLATQASDNSYSGLKQDPLTGKWQGAYSGMGVVEKPDINKAIDTAIEKMKPQGTQFEGINQAGDYVYTSGSSTQIITADRIRNTAMSYLANDNQFQNYLSNYATLMRGSKAYLKGNINPNAVAFTEQVLKSAGKKKGKAEYETIQHTFKELQDKGLLTEDFLYKNALDTHTNSIVNNALNYAVGKYQQADSKSFINNLQQSVASKEAHEKAKEGGYVPLPGAIQVGTDLPQSPAAMTDYVKQYTTQHATNMDQLKQRVKNTVKTLQKDGTYKYEEKDSSGKLFDVTADIRQSMDRAAADGIELARLKAIDDEAKKQAGFRTTPAMEAEIEKRIKRQEALNGVTGGTMGGTGAITPITAADKTNIRNEVYKAYNADAFTRYQNILKEKNKAVTLSFVGLSPLSPTVNKAMSDFFSNASAGAIGAKNGLLTLRYPVGDGAHLQNSQLTEKDWNNIKGEVEFVASVPTGDKSAPVGVLLRAKPGASEETKKKIGMNAIIQTNVDVLEQTIRDPQAKAEFRLLAEQYAGLATPGKEYTGSNGVKVRLENGKVHWWSPDNRSGIASDLLQANFEATNKR